MRYDCSCPRAATHRQMSRRSREQLLSLVFAAQLHVLWFARCAEAGRVHIGPCERKIYGKSLNSRRLRPQGELGKIFSFSEFSTVQINF